MKNRKQERKEGIAFLIIIMLFLIIMMVVLYFYQTRFLKDTCIGGVDVSFLTIEDAIEKVNQEKKDNVVRLNLSEDIIYKASFEELGFQFDYNKFKNIFISQHEDWESSRIYNLQDVILLDEGKTKDFLMQIPELQGEYIIEPKNAYLMWDEEKFYIEKEIIGIKYDFEQVLELATRELKKINTNIDFKVIGWVVPDIVEKDLEKERDYLNSIIARSITFELINGESVVLDSETISRWVYEKEDGGYTINIDGGIYEFVEELAINVDQASESMQFFPTGIEEAITIEIPMEMRAKIDKEKQFFAIKEMLGSKEPINVEPIYIPISMTERLLNLVELDLTRQNVWFYKNGELILDTPCVTGSLSQKGYETPTGVYTLLNKDLDAQLDGFNNDGTPYSAKVKYWIRFYPGYGFHDASWRSQFGGEIYKTSGSHGCVNLPTEAARIMYENIDETVIIIIYKS